MVDATVDNDPVSIVLDGGQSTSVPSNETWRVSIHMGNGDLTRMTIDGIGQYRASNFSGGVHGTYLNITLTGGQTIAEIENVQESVIFITGFVVNS